LALAFLQYGRWERERDNEKEREKEKKGRKIKANDRSEKR